MDFKIRFKFNSLTGEVELFEVDHEGDQVLSEEDHNTQHDNVASELGRLLERFPRISEIESGIDTDEITTPEVEQEDENKANLSSEEKRSKNKQ